MPINTKFKQDTNTFVIDISGEFKFGCNVNFRKAMQEITPTMKNIIVNLKNTEYMDSSSLGMLLILRDHILKNKQDLQIVGAQGLVKKIRNYSA